jgi:DNA polymerase
MTSDLFFGTSGPRNAAIAIVGESWGSEEARQKVPFVGESGKEKDRMLSDAGIPPDSVFNTNVIAKQPQRNKVFTLFHPTKDARAAGVPCVRGLYPTEFVTSEVERLRQQLAIVKPRVIIGFGNYALWALSNECHGVGDESLGKGMPTYKVPTGITFWRGSQLHTREDMGSFKFVPTYHPAAIMRQWPWRYAAVHDIRRRAGSAIDGTWIEPKYNFLIRPSFDATLVILNGIIAQLEDENLEFLPLSVDLETRGGMIACVGIATTPLDAISIPFMCVEDKRGYWNEGEEFAITERLRFIFTHKKAFIIGQNYAYDIQYEDLWLSCMSHLDFDTMIAQRLCFPGTPAGLSYISSLYCEFHCHWKEEGKNWDVSIPEEQLWSYNCKDAVVAFESAGVLRHLVKRFALETQWAEQMEINAAACDMMTRGTLIDSKRRRDLSLELADHIAEREEWLSQVIDWWHKPKSKSPWYRSPLQQAEIFYDEFGLKEIRHPKTRARTCDDAALELIALREPLLQPIIEKIQELRSLGVFAKNFVAAPLDPDGRMRCMYGLAETFRFTSYENAFGRGTNLQNLPKGTEKD